MLLPGVIGDEAARLALRFSMASSRESASRPKPSEAAVTDFQLEADAALGCERVRPAARKRNPLSRAATFWEDLPSGKLWRSPRSS